MMRNHVTVRTRPPDNPESRNFGIGHDTSERYPANRCRYRCLQRFLKLPLRQLLICNCTSPDTGKSLPEHGDIAVPATAITLTSGRSKRMKVSPAFERLPHSVFMIITSSPVKPFCWNSLLWLKRVYSLESWRSLSQILMPTSCKMLYEVTAVTDMVQLISILLWTRCRH